MASSDVLFVSEIASKSPLQYSLDFLILSNEQLVPSFFWFWNSCGVIVSLLIQMLRSHQLMLLIFSFWDLGAIHLCFLILPDRATERQIVLYSFWNKASTLPDSLFSKALGSTSLACGLKIAIVVNCWLRSWSFTLDYFQFDASDDTVYFPKILLMKTVLKRVLWPLKLVYWLNL